jgi:hypothetical protein
MHDWTLRTINFDWQLARVTFVFLDSASIEQIVVAEGVKELRIPHENQWGPSVSVNEVPDIQRLPGGEERLQIEMQSGDVIRVVGRRVILPSD